MSPRAAGCSGTQRTQAAAQLERELVVERGSAIAGAAPDESETQRQVSRITRRNAGDVTASRGAFINSDGAGGSPAWLHAALVGRDEDGCAETATRNISAADRDGQTSAKDARRVCPLDEAERPELVPLRPEIPRQRRCFVHGHSRRDS